MSLQTGRLGHRGNLDEVEVSLLGQTQGVFDADDADLLAVGANQPHLGNPDAVVDARFADVVLLCWKFSVCRMLDCPAAATKKGSPSPLHGKPHLIRSRASPRMGYAARLAPAAYASVTSLTRQP